MTETEARQISASSLAYLGDAYMELLVRRHLIGEGARAGEHPSQGALRFVTAPAQSAALEVILSFLTEAESDVYRRGRNCVHANVPRHATLAEYRRATGLECLFGYLSLTGQTERAETLFRLAYRLDEKKCKEENEDKT